MVYDAVEAHNCVDTDSEISLDEQYTTADKELWVNLKCPAIEYLSTVVYCSSSVTSPSYHGVE